MKSWDTQIFSTLTITSAATEECQIIPFTIYRGKGVDSVLSKNTHIYIKVIPHAKIHFFLSLKQKKRKKTISSLPHCCFKCTDNTKFIFFLHINSYKQTEKSQM